jgi:predicted Zn-dependent protease
MRYRLISLSLSLSLSLILALSPAAPATAQSIRLPDMGDASRSILAPMRNRNWGWKP